MIAVQVKSGASYFEGEDDECVPFTPKPEHANYWASFPMPVILVLHDPTRGMTIWENARSALRDGRNIIRVPKAQRFDAAGLIEALESEGPLPEPAMGEAELVRRMLGSKCPDTGFEISTFDLFFQGLTDAAGSLYFGMDLFHELADVGAALPGRDGRFSIGADTFAFIDRYVAFLVAHSLAAVDFDQWLRASRVHDLVGNFISPLTPRGRALVEYVTRLDDMVAGDGYRRVAQERFVQMDTRGIEQRTEHIVQFKQRFEELAARLAHSDRAQG